MALTDENVAELIALPLATVPGSKMSKERVIWHLDVPVCRILSGLKIHLGTIALVELWRLCYALKCDSPDQLAVVMWDMIKKRKRKDPEWWNVQQKQQ